MKIAFIISNFMQGGIETYILRFLKEYKHKIELIVISNSKLKNEKLLQKYLDNGAKIKFIKVNFNITNIYKFLHFLKTENINTVCDFRGDFSGLTMLLSYFAKIKNRIVFYRESDYQFEMNFFKFIYIKLFHLLVIIFSNKLLSNSKSAFKNFYSDYFLKLKYNRVIYNGVSILDEENERNNDLRKELGIPENSFIVGHVGRYCKAKNHKIILEIFKKISKKNKNIYFLLCGRNVHNGIKNKVNSVKIITPGHCDNILSFYKIMDVFIFPSISEGQPNSLIEAIMLKIPTISSDINSIKEIIPQEFNIPTLATDDVEGFVETILRVYNKEVLYDYDNVSRYFRENFDKKIKFRQFYSELI